MSPTDERRPQLALDPVLMNKINIDAILTSPRHMNIGTVMASKIEDTALELWESPKPLGIENHLKALLQSEMRTHQRLEEESQEEDSIIPVL